MVSFKIDSEVILREFAIDDAEAVFATVKKNYDHLKVFMHWASPDYSLTSAREFIAQSIANRADRKSLGLGFFRESSFLGSIGFVNFDWQVRKTEIGYWIARDEEGKGYVTRAAKLLVDFAFEELQMNRIEIRCSAENVRSSAVPRRLGFKQEGLLRQSEFRNGRLHDFEIYALLVKDRT